MLKLNHTLNGCLIFLTSLLLCGCEIATIEEPVGEPWSLKETKTLEGQWIDPSGNPLELVVVAKGDVRMGSLNWDAQKLEFVATTDRYQLRRIGKMDFAFSDVPEQPKARYYFARLQVRADGSLMWQWPNEKLVFEAVRNGKLTGVLEKLENPKQLHPHLKCSGDELMKWIEETGEDTVFPKLKDDSDFVLRRAQKTENKTSKKK